MATVKKITPDKISMNLDTLEREGGDREPFVVVIGGRTVTFTDATELDWRILMKMGPYDFFVHCLSDEDHEYVMTQPIKGWQIQKMVKAYQDHYGLVDEGNAAGSRT
jgi:hypothetical protein